MRTTTVKHSLMVLGVVGGVVLAAGDRAAAQGGDGASRCLAVKSHCDLTFEFGPIDAPEERFSITGTCAFLHVGRVEVRAEGTANLSMETMSGTLSGTSVYVAANGDELRSTFNGTFVPEGATTPPTTVLVANSEILSGGTGAFEGASGSATVTGFADLQTGVGGIGGEGTVCSGGMRGPAR